MEQWYRFLSSKLLLIGALCIAPVQAQEVSLDEAMELFVQNNLALRIAREEADVFSGLVRQAFAYPNPVAQFTYEPQYRGGIAQSESYATLAQQFEWPELRRARIDASRYLRDAARARVRADSLSLGFDVVRVYIEAAMEEERRAVLETVTDVIRRAEARGAQQLVEGSVSGYDVRRMQIERSRYENILALSELDRTAARNQLALLVFPGGDASALAPSDQLDGIPPSLALEDLLARAQTMRAEVVAAQAEVRASEKALTLALTERRPEPTLTAGFKRQSDGFQGIFLGATLGLPIFNRNTGKIHANTARFHAAETRLMLVSAQVENDVRQAYAAYASLRDRHTLIQEGLLVETEDLLDIALVSYAEGEITLFELFDATSAFRDAQLMSLDLRAAYWTRYFDTLRAAGGPLPKSFN